MNSYLSLCVQLLAWAFPWKLRALVLRRLLGFRIAASARVGYSLILAESVDLECDSNVGSLTLIKGLNRLRLGESSKIGNLNWVTGLPRNASGPFFCGFDRDPSLIIGAHAAITHRHYVDCTDRIHIGDFTTVAGVGSQFFTHSIDLRTGQQRAVSIEIGAYALIGTGAILLPGSGMGDYSVLSAGSVLKARVSEPYTLISGNPASGVRRLPPDFAYFSRTDGTVH